MKSTAIFRSLSADSAYEYKGATYSGNYHELYNDWILEEVIEEVESRVSVDGVIVTCPDRHNDTRKTTTFNCVDADHAKWIAEIEKFFFGIFIAGCDLAGSVDDYFYENFLKENGWKAALTHRIEKCDWRR
ncbi:hypothetical protein A9J41_14390 [Laribacter hongkongensis]|uniref:hypothetical protein n=1 Tax=Laribacter hongkongensis TaxID=168471 RepID=UPI0018789A8C|nr:hypothetical protein [Laribacter hongkongensis]MBE5528924.1 hypothetical protein [Laribacter hongkongensis]